LTLGLTIIKPTLLKSRQRGLTSLGIMNNDLYTIAFLIALLSITGHVVFASLLKGQIPLSAKPTFFSWTRVSGVKIDSLRLEYLFPWIASPLPGLSAALLVPPRRNDE